MSSQHRWGQSRGQSQQLKSLLLNPSPKDHHGRKSPIRLWPVHALRWVQFQFQSSLAQLSLNKMGKSQYMVSYLIVALTKKTHLHLISNTFILTVRHSLRIVIGEWNIESRKMWVLAKLQILSQQSYSNSTFPAWQITRVKINCILWTSLNGHAHVRGKYSCLWNLTDWIYAYLKTNILQHIQNNSHSF